MLPAVSAVTSHLSAITPFGQFQFCWPLTTSQTFFLLGFHFPWLITAVFHLWEKFSLKKTTKKTPNRYLYSCQKMSRQTSCGTPGGWCQLLGVFCAFPKGKVPSKLPLFHLFPDLTFPGPHPSIIQVTGALLAQWNPSKQHHFDFNKIKTGRGMFLLLIFLMDLGHCFAWRKCGLFLSCCLPACL